MTASGNNQGGDLQDFFSLLKKINWEALSVIIALIIFLWGNHLTTVEKEDSALEEIHKTEIMLHSEVEYNLQAVVTGGYEASPFDKIQICIPLPDNDAEALAKLQIVASYLHDDIYRATLNKLQNLPQKTVDGLVRYYNRVGRFKDLSLWFARGGDSQARLTLFKNEYYELMTQSAALEELLRGRPSPED